MPIEPPPDKSAQKGLGALFVIGGVLGAMYYWQVFDTTVVTARGRYHNIGLLQTQQTGLIVSVAAVALGLVLFVLADRASKAK